MGQPLSMDLRSRVLAAIDDGTSCRAAAVRFGVAPSTAIRWFAQRRETGSFAPKPQGGDMRSRRVEEWRADILAVWEAQKDISLEELRLALIEVGLQVMHLGFQFFAVVGQYGQKYPQLRRGITRTVISGDDFLGLDQRQTESLGAQRELEPGTVARTVHTAGWGVP